MAKTHDFDGIAPVEYAESLYKPTGVLPLREAPDPTDASQLDDYRVYGVVGFKEWFSDEEVATARQAILDWVVKGSEHPEEIPEHFCLQFEHLADRNLTSLPPEERQDHVRKLMTFVRWEPRMMALAQHPKILEFARACLGAEPELFQDMALLKPPHIGREKPWHQDHAYFNVPKGTPVLGIWIALDDATLDNGCMHFKPGRHREGPLPHFSVRDWQLCDADMEGDDVVIAAPLPCGGALVFDGLTPHGTPTNHSPTRRRALQFHYIPKGTPRTTTEDRMEIFGAGAHGATC